MKKSVISVLKINSRYLQSPGLKWFNKENGTTFSLNTTELLFRKLPTESSPGLPTFDVFLFAKYYIYTNKLSSKEVILKGFI